MPRLAGVILSRPSSSTRVMRPCAPICAKGSDGLLRCLTFSCICLFPPGHLYGCECDALEARALSTLTMCTTTRHGLWHALVSHLGGEKPQRSGRNPTRGRYVTRVGCINSLEEGFAAVSVSHEMFPQFV